ncbi:MAG TPA: hypothetical protein VKE96_02820 [Vicinamibacterales bacterium]|nr:hypothetical protein [Vicinamibacterales bacterium]
MVTHNVTIAGTMRPIASDYDGDGRALAVQWLHLTPYATSATFTSAVLDAASTVNWTGAAWTGTTPTGTSVVLSVRSGDTAVPDGTWTAYTVAANGAINTTGRYLQYKLDLSTTDTGQAPVIADVTLTFMR